MGIVVLCTFAFAAVACFVLAIRGAIERQWHVAIALLFPGIAIGGTIAFMAGPTVWFALFGNPALKSLPSNAQQVTGSQLQQILTSTLHTGKIYRNGEWIDFQEQYVENNVTGQGGPSSKPKSISWEGTWAIQGNQVCFTMGVDSLPACGKIYHVGKTYYAVDSEDQVDARFTVTKQASGSSGS